MSFYQVNKEAKKNNLKSKNEEAIECVTYLYTPWYTRHIKTLVQQQYNNF